MRFNVSDILERASADGHKTTVMRPLQWVLGILFIAATGSMFSDAPGWWLVLLAVLICITMAIMAYAYIYAIHKSPDLLRSEKYTLRKLAIEKSLMGDDLHGILEPSKTRITPPDRLPAGDESGEGGAE